MTSRQRILAAARRQPVDRLPVSLYELDDVSDGWAASEPSYRPLLELQRRCGDMFVFAACGAGLFQDPSEVRGHSEVASSGVETFESLIDTPRGRLRRISRRDPGIATTWTVKHWIESDGDLDRFLSLQPSFTPPDLGELRRLEQKVGADGVLVFSIGDPLGNVASLFDYTDFQFRCLRDLGPLKALLEMAAGQLREQIDFVNRHFRDAFFRLWGPEYAGPPLMDPARFFQPLVVDYDAPLVERIRRGGNLAALHCHGRLQALLDMILEIGPDLLEPLELLPSATADVTMRQLKHRLGGRMCLAGGMQAVELETGSPARIRERVRELAEQGGPSGLILLPTSAPLQIPLPRRILDNYRALFETAAAQPVR